MIYNKLRRRNAALRAKVEILERKLERAEARADREEKQAAEFCGFGIDAVTRQLVLEQQIKKEKERAEFFRSRLEKYEAVKIGDFEVFFEGRKKDK